MGDAGMLQIFVLTTGGSLDKTYSGEASDFVVAEPVVRDILMFNKCGHQSRRRRGGVAAIFASTPRAPRSAAGACRSEARIRVG